jgi:hypothetical protein
MVSATTTDRDFYAVRPELVLRAADVFGISSSMLEKGAKTLYSRAVAIEAGKEAGQWGRHQRPVIQQFCNYTQTSGSAFLLPWQELVEHQSFYDGREGISTRTGNKPLSTVVRLVVDADALRRARDMKGLSVEAFAEAHQMPPLFLLAIESGTWPDVAESTASIIALGLDVPVSELFSKMGNAANSPAVPTVLDNVKGRSNLNTFAFGAVVTIALGAVGYAVLQQNSPVSPEKDFDTPQPTPVLVGCWQWSNGMRIVVTEDNIANNGFGAGPWMPVEENRFGIEWPDHTTKITLSSDGQNLRGTDMFGVKTTATRIQGDPNGFVGTWQWDNGGIVNIAPGGQMTLAFLYGHWSKHGQDYQVVWPIHDEIVVAADGNSLSGHNQFGTFAATRDFDCTEI